MMGVNLYKGEIVAERGLKSYACYHGWDNGTINKYRILLIYMVQYNSVGRHVLVSHIKYRCALPPHGRHMQNKNHALHLHDSKL